MQSQAAIGRARAGLPRLRARRLRSLGRRRRRLGAALLAARRCCRVRLPGRAA